MTPEATAMTLQALRNSGIDTECGACMAVAFTGVTLNAHTCERGRKEVPLAEHGSADCPTYYDGCHCTVETLRHNIERAELAEAERERLDKIVCDAERAVGRSDVALPTAIERLLELLAQTSKARDEQMVRADKAERALASSHAHVKRTPISCQADGPQGASLKANQAAADAAARRIAARTAPVRWRHFKGGLYTELARGKDALSDEDVIVYRSETDGTVWVRPAYQFSQFIDGSGPGVLRFTREP